ncbi:MAG: HTH-type transcriptional repressor KstR2 [Chlamydiia bacterium]|nr:HTH-type transcriptional repressor KstR2 [Chlamydiia bacterium]
MNTRQLILKTAKTLFLTQGYESTTMSDIMKSLNIAKGTIYHHFESKDVLFAAVLEDIVDQLVKKLTKVVTQSDLSAIEKVQALVREGNISHENDALLEELHKPVNSALHTRLLALTVERLAPLYARVIEQGCDEGTFHTKAPLECAEMILSSVQFLTDQGIYAWSMDSLKRRNQGFPLLIEQLLSAPKGSFNFLNACI